MSLQKLIKEAKKLSFKHDCILGAKSDFLYLSDAVDLIEQAYNQGRQEIKIPENEKLPNTTEEECDYYMNLPELSECCGANITEEGRCSDCKEGCR